MPGVLRASDEVALTMDCGRSFPPHRKCIAVPGGLPLLGRWRPSDTGAVPHLACELGQSVHLRDDCELGNSLLGYLARVGRERALLGAAEEGDGRTAEALVHVSLSLRWSSSCRGMRLPVPRLRRPHDPWLDAYLRGQANGREQDRSMRNNKEPQNKELERTRSTHFAVSPRRSIQCCAGSSKGEA